MNGAERLEKLKEIFDDLFDIPDDHVLIVEGQKDKMALWLAGVSGRMTAVQSEGGPLKVAERLFEEKMNAVILTDWDHEGEKIAKELERCLSSLCIKYDLTIRRRLRSVCGNEIRDIESLPSFNARLVNEHIRGKEVKTK
ncbi:MAG: toprim domain-containing protein [Methanomassiliicoccaceae archaeon]|nr:toprim domain-containing protein [Methanomassiliicoccaceae archaeon]